MGLVLFDFMVLRSVGVAGAVVVALAVAGALTLLPAVLAVLGPRIDRLSVRGSARVLSGADRPVASGLTPSALGGSVPATRATSLSGWSEPAVALGEDVGQRAHTLGLLARKGGCGGGGGRG